MSHEPPEKREEGGRGQGEARGLEEAWGRVSSLPGHSWDVGRTAAPRLPGEPAPGSGARVAGRPRHRSQLSTAVLVGPTMVRAMPERQGHMATTRRAHCFL